MKMSTNSGLDPGFLFGGILIQMDISYKTHSQSRFFFFFFFFFWGGGGGGGPLDPPLNYIAYQHFCTVEGVSA